MNKHTIYRSDIDGLRALAVLLVLFFHAGFSFFQGGYVGVDVFFVISGFLITLTIDKELSLKTFSFKNFYLRRIRRIIPVLVFVMLACTIPAYFILFANNLEIFGRTLIHTILATNNFYLYIVLNNYFSENADFIPFVHTWSLAVEEQFYFLWPVLLLLLHRYFLIKKRLQIILAAVFVSFFISIWLTNSNSSMAYFLLPARFFELLIGAALAIYWNFLPEYSKKINTFISIVGLFLIVLPAIFLSKSSVFPGWNALWPTLGTACIVFSGKTQNQGFVNILLKQPFLVWIGLLSYSIYLWHWPIFAFIRYCGIELVGHVRVLAILITFVLSYFSWKYIEQPFRIKIKFNFKKTIYFLFIPAFLLIATIYGVLDKMDGIPKRFNTLSEFNAKENHPNFLRKKCFDTFLVGNCQDCFLGIKKTTPDAMLIGDSFANHTAAFLDVLAKDAAWNIHDSAAGGYPLLTSLDADGNPKKDIVYAIERLEYAKKFKTIFIAANWDEQQSASSKNYKNIIQIIGSLLKKGKNIVIIDCLLPTTELNLHRAKWVKSGNKVFFDQKDFSIPKIKRPNWYIVYQIKRQFPKVQIIDLNDAMCKDKNCEIAIDGTIVYRNFNHLNTSGAKKIAQKYLIIKGNPLKNYPK